MTQRIGNVVIIEEEPEGVCEQCGVLAEETRPYGPGGIRICFDCGMKDEKGTHERMMYALWGDPRAN